MDNEAVVHRHFEEVWQKRKVETIDELVAPSYVDHDPPPGFDGTRDTQKQVAALMRDTGSDKRLEIGDLLSSGDKVAVRYRMEWTQVGSFWGMIPADGRRISMRGSDFYRLEDGTIVERPHVEDMLGVMAQLGAFPQVAGG